MRYLNPLYNPWSEVNIHTLECLEELVKKNNDKNFLSKEQICLIKDTIFKILSLLPYREDDKFYYNKVGNLFSFKYTKYRFPKLHTFLDRAFMFAYPA